MLNIEWDLGDDSMNEKNGIFGPFSLPWNRKHGVTYVVIAALGELGFMILG